MKRSGARRLSERAGPAESYGEFASGVKEEDFLPVIYAICLVERTTKEKAVFMYVAGRSEWCTSWWERMWLPS